MNWGWFSSKSKIVDDDKVANFVDEALKNDNQMCFLCTAIKNLNILLRKKICNSYFECYQSLNTNNDDKQLLITLVPTYLAHAEIKYTPYKNIEKYKQIFNAICTKYIESVPKTKLNYSKIDSNYSDDTQFKVNMPYGPGIHAGGRKRSRQHRKSKKSRRSKKSKKY
jgi:hypothetical protein